MRVSGTLISLTMPAFLLVLMLPLISSSQEFTESAGRNPDEVNPELMSEVTVHGFLLWASMGFSMLAGILIIRMVKGEESSKRATTLLRAHAILQLNTHISPPQQVLSALLTTVAAIMSIKNFDNSFKNSHQRIGIALYGLIWLQVLTGFSRPQRGSKGRSMWFLGHWALGTVVALLGVINIYTGLLAYHKKTSRSIITWTIIFTSETCVIAVLYLLQDKWLYIQKGRWFPGSEPSISTDETVSACKKRNGLQLI